MIELNVHKWSIVPFPTDFDLLFLVCIVVVVVANVIRRRDQSSGAFPSLAQGDHGNGTQTHVSD